jgi:hypothetical protein
MTLRLTAVRLDSLQIQEMTHTAYDGYSVPAPAKLVADKTKNIGAGALPREARIRG